MYLTKFVKHHINQTHRPTINSSTDTNATVMNIPDAVVVGEVDTIVVTGMIEDSTL